MRSIARYVLVALVSGLLGASLTPAVAAAYDARNADKVDGKHAVSSTTTASKRRNKLVAAGKTGFLPNNIIKMAPNSAKLEGKTLAQVVGLATDVYSAGAGLDQTDGTFSVLDSFRLPQGCADGEVPSAAAGVWQCITLPDEAASYTAGYGLTLADNEFSLDMSTVQSPVLGPCPVGSYVRGIATGGQVTCDPDADTTYTAGQGLGLSGGAFNVAFGGSGAATTAARSDHNHNGVYLGIAAKAADADRLDGLDSSQLVSDGCPSGWISDGLLCWRSTSDDSGGSQSLPMAVDFCRQRGGRLPLLSEFIAMRQSGINIGTILGDWTASSAGDDNSIYINSNDATNMDGVRANATTSNGWARCVRPLVNDLGSS